MQHRVKLAYVTTLPVAQWGFLRGQNAYLSAHGFDLHAISSPNKYLDKLARRDQVTIHPVPIARTISPVQDLATIWRLFRVFRRIRPEIAHVSTPKAALLGAAAAWAARVPVRIFCIRGSITEPASGVRRGMFRLAERTTARLCHQAICVSESLLEFARSESILSERTGMVPASGMSNGIDVERFNPDAVDGAALASLPETVRRLGQDPDALVIGYVGRLASDKGIEYLHQAWTAIRGLYPTAHLLVAGPWEHHANVSRECRADLESDPRVHLVGEVEDVVPYYTVMSLFVFPSLGSEGFPNAPMEAAAMRLPVVATRVVGCVDAVDNGVTGTLVPPRDANALAAAIRIYLDDPALRQRHGDAGRVRVQSYFRQERVWTAIHREYVRLLEARGVYPGASRAAVIGAGPPLAGNKADL